MKNYWNTHIRSRSNKEKLKTKSNEALQQHAKVSVIKPQPRTFSRTQNCNPPISANEDSNLVTSTDHGVNNALNMPQGLIYSSIVSDDKIDEYLDDLFNEEENEFDREIDWTLVGSPVINGEDLRSGKEDGENSLFHLPDEVMWDFLDSEQL